MKQPEPFDLVSAKLSTTPYCYYSFNGIWRYFPTLNAALKAAKGKQVWVLNKETGDWNPI